MTIERESEVTVFINVTGRAKMIGVDNSNEACFGRKTTFSRNLEIFPGIGSLVNFSGKYDIVPGYCKKKDKFDIFTGM